MNRHHNRLKLLFSCIVLISILLISGMMFYIYSFLTIDNENQPVREGKSAFGGYLSSLNGASLIKKNKKIREKIKRDKDQAKKVRTGQDDKFLFSNNHSESAQEEAQSSSFVPRNDFPTPDVTLADIAEYDPMINTYVVKRINLYGGKRDVTGNLLSILKILNRKNGSYLDTEYRSAYQEIDFYYPDVYIWPYFTNQEAKINFFLNLFTKYATDNKNWRSYEKDRSDCSQFSQRVYLFLSPDEVLIPDEKYFLFLFSSPDNRLERNKLCNKIPRVFYTTIRPYCLKEESFTPCLANHAMISFAPDDGLERLIVAEPQNGKFENFSEGFVHLFNREYARRHFWCELGKVKSIYPDDSHEAKTTPVAAYFCPRSVPISDPYPYDSPKRDYGDQPVLLDNLAYQIHNFIYPCLTSILNYQPYNSTDVIGDLEKLYTAGKYSMKEIEKAINSSIDIMMYGFIDLDSSDMRRVLEKIRQLKVQVDQEDNLCPETRYFIQEIDYLFALKAKAFLE